MFIELLPCARFWASNGDAATGGGKRHNACPHRTQILTKQDVSMSPNLSCGATFGYCFSPPQSSWVTQTDRVFIVLVPESSDLTPSQGLGH